MSLPAATTPTPTDGADRRAIRIAAVIPVYNERDTLEEIVSRLERVDIVRQIVIADDGSIDGTRGVIEALAAAGRVDAVLHESNQGKGAALRSGLALVREEYLVIQDADLEYDPNDFPALVEAIHRQNAQVVYGSRFLGGARSGMLWTHYLGNRLLTLIFNLMYWRRLSDMETCYKLFRTNLLRRLRIEHDDFDVDPELTAKIVRAGLTIVEVPISYTGRSYVAGKKIRARHALSAVRTLWSYRRWQPPVSADEPSLTTAAH